MKDLIYIALILVIFFYRDTIQNYVFSPDEKDTPHQVEKEQEEKEFRDSIKVKVKDAIEKHKGH